MILFCYLVTTNAVASGFTFLTTLNQLQKIIARFGPVQIATVLDAQNTTALSKFRTKRVNR